MFGPLVRAALCAAVSAAASSAGAQVLVPLPGTRAIDKLSTASTSSDSAALLKGHDKVHAGLPDSAARSFLLTANLATKDSTESARRRIDTLGRFQRFKATLINNGEWCNAARTDTSRHNAIEFCHFYSSSQEAAKAAQTFWNGRLVASNAFDLAKMLNVVGDDRGQSTKVELLSDYWNTVRVGLSASLTSNTASNGQPRSGTSTAAGAPSTNRFVARDAGASPSDNGDNGSKAQQFLNGGGPVSLRMERPFLAVNLLGTNSVVLAHATSSFTAPASGQSGADSLQFATTGIDLQTQVDGAARVLTGIANLHFDRTYGGRAFYRAANSDTNARSAFAVGSFSAGLVLEQSVQISWNKIFYGPRSLQQGASFITINVSR